MSEKDPFQEIYRQLKKDRFDRQETGSWSANLDRQRLEALYLVSQELNKILDPDRLFRVVIKKIINLLRAERAVILLRNGEELQIRISHNIDHQSQQNALNFSRSIVSRVIDDVKPLFSTNAIEDSRFSQFQTIQQLEILSFICVPIRVEKEVIGTIYVDNRHLTNVFSEADVEFLQGIANLLGIAIRNSLAYREIETLNKSLEDKVKERTSELRKSIEELKQTQQRLIQSEKMASLGHLIAGFVHEFNNPINFIYSNLPHLENYARQLIETVDGLLKRLPKNERRKTTQQIDWDYVKTDLVKLIGGIREGARRSRQIVEDLKNFSVSGKPAFEVLDWNDNLTMLTRLFRERLAKPIQVTLRFKETLSIRASRPELNQALMNLLHNAADAGATTITIDSRRQKNKLQCEIHDNGSGIPQEDLNKVFDPFYTTREVGKGMGLGLSIVYSTIMHHQGRIEVSSRRGSGTTFRLTLPLAEEIMNPDAAENSTSLR